VSSTPWPDRTLGLKLGLGVDRVVYRERRAQAPGALVGAAVLYGLRDVPRAAARQEVREIDRHEDGSAAIFPNGCLEGTRGGWIAVMGSGQDLIELRDVGCGRLGLCQDAGCCFGIIGTDGTPQGGENKALLITTPFGLIRWPADVC
jgi:hypothetical protein